MPTKTKRPEIVLATWPLRRGVEFFGDRDFGDGVSGCTSLWLSLRVVDDDSYQAYKLRQTMVDIGLWVWFTTDGVSIHCEFRAHEVHSATVDEVQRILNELKRLNKRVPPRIHEQRFIDHVFAALQSAGIKRAVEYRGIGVDDQYTGLGDAQQALAAEIERRLKRAA